MARHKVFISYRAAEQEAGQDFITRFDVLIAFVVAAQTCECLRRSVSATRSTPTNPVGEFKVGPYDDTPEGRMYASGRSQRPATSIAEIRQRGHRVRCGETV